VGYRDEERKIICKINIEGMKIQSFLIQLSRVLSTISSKKPYISENLILQRRPETEELTPKVISDTSRILEKLGLNRVGLSEDDAKVYLALLRKGEKGEKVGSLDKELDLKRTHIYRIIERLLQKDWVDKLAKTPKGAQFFTARPLNNLLDAFIKEKTEEIKILKGLKSIISDDYKNGWKIITEVEKDLKGQFDLDIQEIIGNEKDCGIVIYEYDRIIKGEENLDKVKLRLYSNKLETIILERKEIGKLKDLNEVKVDEIDIQDYYGAIISVSYKSGSKVEDKAEKDWNIVAKLVSIPIDNKIYIIWGSEEKFQILMDMILKIG
jgi:predicted transcriptional regulator